MITAHPAPSARPLGQRGLNLMRMPGLVLMWRKPAATESVARDERENLPPDTSKGLQGVFGWSSVHKINLKKDHISNQNELAFDKDHFQAGLYISISLSSVRLFEAIAAVRTWLERVSRSNIQDNSIPMANLLSGNNPLKMVI